MKIKLILILGSLLMCLSLSTRLHSPKCRDYIFLSVFLILEDGKMLACST